MLPLNRYFPAAISLATDDVRRKDLEEGFQKMAFRIQLW